jgi:hypothetical protein
LKLTKPSLEPLKREENEVHAAIAVEVNENKVGRIRIVIIEDASSPMGYWKQRIVQSNELNV